MSTDQDRLLVLSTENHQTKLALYFVCFGFNVGENLLAMLVSLFSVLVSVFCMLVRVCFVC